MLPIEFTELAGLELADAYDWYEEKRFGLGDDLLEEVRAASHRVQEYPRSYQVVEEADGRKIRRSPIHRFPYALFYELLEDRIVVIAVFHARREPALRIGR